MKTAGIEYEEGGVEKLEIIKPLWEKLNLYHLKKATNFKEHYEQLSYEVRIKSIVEKSLTGNVAVLLAKDMATGAYIGYCICTEERDGTGEIESLFVDESYRGMGIGERLMEKALAWLASMGTKSYKIVVAEGNEGAFRFYEKFGFYHRSSVLTKKA